MTRWFQAFCIFTLEKDPPIWLAHIFQMGVPTIKGKMVEGPLGWRVPSCLYPHCWPSGWLYTTYCWWFRNPALTSWGWYVLPLFTGFCFFYIPGGDRRISEPSTVPPYLNWMEIYLTNQPWVFLLTGEAVNSSLPLFEAMTSRSLIGFHWGLHYLSYSLRVVFKSSLLVFQQDVSENVGTPKSSILIGFSIINHPFWGTPIFGNTQQGFLGWQKNPDTSRWHDQHQLKSWFFSRFCFLRNFLVGIEILPPFLVEIWETPKWENLVIQNSMKTMGDVCDFVTRSAAHLNSPILETILYWKIQHFALRLSPKMSRNAAPATSFAEKNHAILAGIYCSILFVLKGMLLVFGLIPTEKDGAVIIPSRRWISWNRLYMISRTIFYRTLYCPSLSVGLVHYIKQNICLRQIGSSDALGRGVFATSFAKLAFRRCWISPWFQL